MSTARVEISSPSFLYFKAVEGAHLGSALIDKKNGPLNTILKTFVTVERETSTKD